MEITIDLKWLITIIATLVWIILFRRGLNKSKDGFDAILAVLLPTFGYTLFWIIWLIIFG